MALTWTPAGNSLWRLEQSLSFHLGLLFAHQNSWQVAREGSKHFQIRFPEKQCIVVRLRTAVFKKPAVC